MTIISYDTENANGPGFTFSSGYQSLLVKNNVILTSSSSYGVTSSYNGNNVSNYGNIFSSSYGVYMAGTSGYSQIINQTSATVTGSYAIFISEAGDRIVNNGSIDGRFAGIYTRGTNTNIINTGKVTADYYAIYAIYGGHAIRNDGTLSATSYGIYTAVSEGSQDTIVNTGSIGGTVCSVSAQNGFLGSLVITNSGSLHGDVLLSGGSDRIRNTGAIYGDVVLGDGTNRFDGRDGIMTGQVTGGVGVDTIISGDDGETLDGDKGHDRLYAGAGADTFAISSFAAGDTDVFKRFDVAKDLFQLDHSVFTHLRADTAPTFAIGTQASSPTDFLFYNSGTGGLFYDVDGNGAARAPYLLATLDKGLKLTASNFDVV